jgi:hypothetical protein
MIIPFLGNNVKEYQQNYPVLLSRITPVCPICGGRCHSHCWYDRKVRGPDTTVIKILRVKCTQCGSTHAILPDFLFPKGRYSEHMREEAIFACETGKITQEEASASQSVKTTSRWLKRYREKVAGIIAALGSVLAKLGEYETAITGAGLEQMRQMCAKVETVLGRVITASSLFGKANILLAWGSTGVWI